MSKIRIYVEGGGNSRLTLVKCRKGFAKFFEKVVPEGRILKIIACGSRSNTYEKFARAYEKHVEDTVILLVDSEGPLSESVWEHLKKHDKWDSKGFSTDSAQLMVQCMESWFLADKDFLQKFYGQGFAVKSLPSRKNIEEISKVDVGKGLDNASRKTSKEKYHKTKHAFDILASIDPRKLDDAQVSKHAHRLFSHLRQLTVDP